MKTMENEVPVPPHNLHLTAVVEIARLSLRRFHVSMPNTHQRNELRVQPVRRGKAVWPVPRAPVRRVQRDSREYGPVPESYCCSRYRHSRLKVTAASFPSAGENCGFSMSLIGDDSSESDHPWLLARFCDFERPEHAPWSPGGTHTCAVVYRRAPCVPRGQEREKRPATGKEKFYSIPEKNTFLYIHTVIRQGPPFRVWLSGNPGGVASCKGGIRVFLCIWALRGSLVLYRCCCCCTAAVLRGCCF